MEKKEVFVMVDTEYSGDIPGDFSLLTIGATIVGQHVPPFNKTFYVQMKPLPDAGVDPEAMAVNKLDLDWLREHGTVPHEAMRLFSRWVFDNVPRAFAYPVMVADGQHDFMYIRWYLKHFRIDNPFVTSGYNSPGHGIDMKSYLMGKHPGLTISKTRRASVVAEFPEYRSDFLRTHHALDDAIEQAERFHRMRQR